MKNERDFLDRCYNLAVLGGTFDPIHTGHLAIAEAVLRQIKPQRVLFMPCAQSPHKLGQKTASAKHRFHMVNLAICEHPFYDISRIEIDKPGPSYTIDTAHTLRAAMPNEAEINFIIGADTLESIATWRKIDKLLQVCSFVVVARPGYDKTNGTTIIKQLAKNHAAKFQWIEGPMLNISSTDIRERLTTGSPTQGLMPSVVEDYAKLHGLYGTNRASLVKNAMKPKYFKSATETLRQRLSPKRFLHTMGVVKEAKKLAHHYNQDIDKARWAALLHDCTKEYSADKKRALCKLWGVQLDKTLESKIDLTHSLLGAESARRDFNIHDPEILQAIRYHTTGHIGMTMLDKIIMIADYIEPNREDWGPLNQMRKLALTNIDQALILGKKYTINEEKAAGQPVHTWTLDALKELGG